MAPASAEASPGLGLAPLIVACGCLGIGTALLAWIEHRALTRPAEHAERRVGQTVKDSNAGAITLFVRQGYEIRHTSWVLRLPDDVTIDDVRLPDGVSIRSYRRASRIGPSTR